MSDILGPGRGRLAAAAALRRVGSFVADGKGSIAITFALLLGVLIAFIGAAVDYSRLANARSEYQIACDRGLLAAMRELQVNQQAGATTDLSSLPAMAKRSFDNNLRALNKSYGATFSSTYVEDADHTKITGTGTFSAPVPMGVGSIISGTSVTVGGDCQIVVGAAPNVDFHFLVDTSMSMGLVATVADRTLMLAGTAADPRLSDLDRATTIATGVSRGCQFACHSARPNDNGSLPTNQVSTLAWAREHGIRLRIDVERDGIKAFINHATATAGSSNIRYSLSTFNWDYRKVRGPSSGTDIKGEADSLTLGYPNDMTSPDVATQPERENVFPAFAGDLKTYMNSPAAAGYRQVVILVTDGVRSQPGFTFANGAIHEFKPELCATLKNSGAMVAVLYTKYLEDPTDPIFVQDVKPFYDDIEPALRNNCASDPSLFVAAETPEEIEAGFKQLFDVTTRALALSQ